MTDETFSITLLRESRFGLDGGAMFGIIPRPIWEKTNPADEANRIEMAARNVLIQKGEKKILIDVGMGENWSKKERSIYKIEDQDPALIQQFQAQGITPEDITDVILTHLHFDHAGGLLKRTEEGLQPTFPKATHWVQRQNWAWAHYPSQRDQGSYRREDFDFLGTGDGPELRLVDGIDEILPGIEVLPLHGHTVGMQAVKIKGPEHTYLFLADLIPTSSHFRAPYVMGYDLAPLKTVEEKKELLYHGIRQDWILLFSHDPFHGIGRVEEDSKRQPRFIALSEDFLP